MPRTTPRRDDAADAAFDMADATGEPMTPAAPGAAITGDGSGSGAALPPIPPTHEWNDEFTGVGGSYVVIDGKRVPADQA